MAVYLITFLAAEFLTFFWVPHKVVDRPKMSISLCPFINKKIQIPELVDMAVYFSAIPFFIVAAIRYNVGTDYAVYKRLQIPEVMRGITWRVELLYRYLIRIGMSTGDVQWVFVITHFVILIFLWKAIKDQSPSLAGSVFVFMFGAFYNNSLNLMRQFIAMAICLYAIKYAIARKPWHYAFWMVAAFLFHKTAMVYIPVYFLVNLKLSEFVPLLISVSAGILSPIARMLMVGFIRISGIYHTYIDDIRFDLNDPQIDFIILELIILLICMFSIYGNSLYNSNIKNGDISNSCFALQCNTYLWLQTICTSLACLSRIIPNSTRIILLCAVGQIVYTPFFVYHIEDKQKRFWVVVLLGMVYLLLFFRLIIMRGVGETLPFQTIFSGL